jgi:polyferredoxin
VSLSKGWGAGAAISRTDKIARKAVQVGFLLLFLYPLVPVIYRQIALRAVPTLTSWLLPWDPLLLLGHLVRREWVALVIGAPLLLLALTLIFGRAFCGWVCPMGTVLDIVRPVAFWEKGKRAKGQRGKGARGIMRLFPANANSALRYYLLVAVLAAGVLSLQALGLLDPLVIFHRAATALTMDLFALQQPALRAFFAVLSLIFLGILALELWQPRFWCRNLCPLGALVSVFGRWSLLNRRVSERCNRCGDCRRLCVMNAIPKEPHNTDYSDCTFCLECESVCPNAGISFGFGTLAGKTWQRSRGAGGQGDLLGVNLTRRQFIGGAAAGAAGLAVVPLLQLDRRQGVIRPPGALPEAEFVRTCILCQECVRVCPTGGLKPTFLEAGLAAVGTPRLVPRAGACALNPSCPNLCAQVCPVGAIRPIPREEMELGLAEVDHPLCLAWDQGVKCLVCVEACLVEAAQVYNGRIVVDPTRCTGCGRCENACPVAGGAIHVKSKT